MKVVTKKVSIMLVIALALAATLMPIAAQQAVSCEQDYTVQLNDSLWKIADKSYGNGILYRAIAAATNAEAATDNSYTAIQNVSLIHPGWKLCIPSAADARGEQLVALPESPATEPVALDASFITSTLPVDIQGGAGSANLQDAALFAWQTFIALNWPAKDGVRDTPADLRFGDPGYTGPLVWETYRAKVELYPGSDHETPNGYVPDKASSYGYDSGPEYLYNGTVPPCDGQPAADPPAWVNLDEISQIGLDYMSAGVVPDSATAPPNMDPQLIRFLAKANRVEYNYVAENHYWDHGGNYMTATQNFKNAIAKGQSPNPADIILFPSGTIEVKAGWRPLASGEDAGRFHMAPVRYYDDKTPDGPNHTPCYREETWALAALHIIYKTPTAPYFVYATFGQADNILTADGKPVEDPDGNIINPPQAPNDGSTTPQLAYMDSPTDPKVTIVGSEYCADAGAKGNARLYYDNITEHQGLPIGGSICVNKRDNPIPPTVIDVNMAVHQAIADYVGGPSPWQYYKLVNVQWQPFDKQDIDPSDPNGNRNMATYYQANIVVETNYPLQLFSGRMADNGAATDYPRNGAQPDFKNVYVLGNTGTSPESYNMGGCMGCHGNAQVLGGTDFSFILRGGAVKAPDFPHPEANEKLIEKYFITVSDPSR